jgi:putative membrane protein
MNTLGWLLQWPIRALVLLLVAALPLGVEMANFGTAFWAAVMIGLLGTLLIWPLKFVLGPAWAITSLGGLIAPVSFLFNWLITIVLFGIAAWLINGFRLKHGLFSVILGAGVYIVISAFVLRALGFVDVEATRAALISVG